MTPQPESPSLPADHEARLERALLSLDGLSVGDAFGQRFFHPFAEYRIEARRVPEPPWGYTDDTEMALGILEVLRRHGRVDRDDLAATFARHYRANPHRGYGATAHGVLQAIGAGVPWTGAASAAFDGMGSMGNGGAMRVAPLGAYFADDLSDAVEQARASAEVTHGHPEGQAGAVAVAVAAACAWAMREDPQPGAGQRLLETVLEHTPDGETHRGIGRALALPFEATVASAVGMLGNGSGVIAPDTVPFALWCAARHLDNYAEVLWATVSGLGDRDTTCAIVGGIVALSAGPSLLAEWLQARESLVLFF